MWLETRRFIATVLTVAMTFETTGCAGWVAVPRPGAESPTKYRLADLRLTLLTDPVITLSQGGLANDTVTGVLKEVRVGSRKADSLERRLVFERFAVTGAVDSLVAVPLDAIRAFERYSDPYGPLPILILLALGVLGVAASYSLENLCCGK